MKKYNALLLGVIVGLILSIPLDMLFFGPQRANAHWPTKAFGWNKLVPLHVSINYASNGSYYVAINNINGVPILITNVSINDTKSGVPCMEIKVSNFNEEPSLPLKVKAGDALTVYASCPPKERGSEYEVSMSIDYVVTIGGRNTSYSEHGTTKWFVE